MKNVFKTSHYRANTKKWSGRLPVNYNNEKSKSKGKIFSTDTVQGCTNGCVGCYAARCSQMCNKNFTTVKNVRLVGRPTGKPFLWTAGQHPIPKEIMDSDIGINVSIDPMREKAFFSNSLRTILSIEPRRVLVALKLYPENPISLSRCNQVATMLRSIGYKGILHVIMRILDKKTAGKLNCKLYPKGKKKEFYKQFKENSLGIACGSLGEGYCKDCMFCFRYHFGAKYRVGTSSDPALRWDHTVKEFKRMGWLK